MKENTNFNISTVDNNGVPYGKRLKQARESRGSSPQEVAAQIGFSVPSYYDLENCEGELTTVISLGELSKLSSVLGISTRFIFDDAPEDGKRISSEQLCVKIKTQLKETGLSISEFEERVGFEIESSLKDAAMVMDWNVDCLRFVCAEIGFNWLDVIP